MKALLSLSNMFELFAFAAIAVLLAHFFDPWWALLPAGVYSFLLSLAVDRGKR